MPISSPLYQSNWVDNYPALKPLQVQKNTFLIYKSTLLKRNKLLLLLLLLYIKEQELQVISYKKEVFFLLENYSRVHDYTLKEY